MNFEVVNLKPFACLAFPLSAYRENALKRPGFGDELVTSFRARQNPPAPQPQLDYGLAQVSCAGRFSAGREPSMSPAFADHLLKPRKPAERPKISAKPRCESRERLLRNRPLPKFFCAGVLAQNHPCTHLAHTSESSEAAVSNWPTLGCVEKKSFRPSFSNRHRRRTRALAQALPICRFRNNDDSTSSAAKFRSRNPRKTGCGS